MSKLTTINDLPPELIGLIVSYGLTKSDLISLIQIGTQSVVNYIQSPYFVNINKRVDNPPKGSKWKAYLPDGNVEIRISRTMIFSPSHPRYIE